MAWPRPRGVKTGSRDAANNPVVMMLASRLGIRPTGNGVVLNCGAAGEPPAFPNHDAAAWLFHTKLKAPEPVMGLGEPVLLNCPGMVRPREVTVPNPAPTGI